MAHCIVPEAEAILDKEYPVLDKGFVRLVDYFGGDQRIVQSARVSYGEGTKSVSQDGALIDYLLRHQHTSPFEQVVMTFHVKMPIFVARQWVRHRTGRMNEVSGRYSIMKEEFYVPAEDKVAPQSKDNKQGRCNEAFDKETADRKKLTKITVSLWILDLHAKLPASIFLFLSIQNFTGRWIFIIFSTSLSFVWTAMLSMRSAFMQK